MKVINQVMKNTKLQEFISQEFREKKSYKYCILIDCDNTTGYLLFEDEGEIYLEKTLLSMGKSMDAEILSSVSAAINIPDTDGLEKLLYNEKSEVNKKLQRYIYSDGLMNGKLFDDRSEKNDCKGLEASIAEQKRMIFKFADDVQLECEKEKIDENESFFVLAGRTLKFALIKIYYLAVMSYDPLLADPRVALYEDVIGDCDFEKKNIWKSSDIIMQTEVGEKTITLDVCDVASEIAEYTGPIFMSSDDVLRVEVDGKIIKVPMPYSIKPLDSDLVEIALFGDGGKKYIRVKRCLYPTRYYDVELVEE